MDRHLNVLIAGVVAGQLTQNDSGSLSFSYEGNYSGVPLSVSMPVSNRRYGDKMVRPYLMGLLPDSAQVRQSLGRELGVSGNNPFDLLLHMGLDCPGAVQLCDDAALSEAIEGKGFLRPVSDEDIAARLAAGRADFAAKWETDKEHWSLGGQQSKFALRLEDGCWFSCEGAAATTHIFKPGISDLRFEALNEFVCMKLARLCQVPVAEVDYRVFDGEPAIIVARYDRARSAAGKVVRLHQEDFCQALGVLPENKYPEEGGPGANDVVRILKGMGDAARNNVERFMSMVFFNSLVCAPDAHAKNYSLLLDRQTAYLAPMYDVASMLPYADRPFETKTAMGIAGENRVGRLSRHRLKKFVAQNGLDELGVNIDTLVGEYVRLASAIPDGFQRVISDYAHLPGMEELGERTMPVLTELCSRAVSRMQ